MNLSVDEQLEFGEKDIRVIFKGEAFEIIDCERDSKNNYSAIVIEIGEHSKTLEYCKYKVDWHFAMEERMKVNWWDYC